MMRTDPNGKPLQLAAHQATLMHGDIWKHAGHFYLIDCPGEYSNHRQSGSIFLAVLLEVGVDREDSEQRQGEMLIRNAMQPIHPYRMALKGCG